MKKHLLLRLHLILLSGFCPLLMADPAPFTPQEEADQKAATNFDTTGFDFQAADGPVKPTLKSLAENYQ